ncbi:HTH-type transcriptional regulator / antitoxin HigA [Dyadobacter sp. SG02]|uniref:hypothetical protein n=1 Tax=Dyadobacter sp. SG02 TaxID=1855291 RepID=UPI0008AFEDDE|nr:hypothetical protein [Dyadobacter sp. SG02]SEJ14467.1 HTH-type transcriptional regulator / antitoxin HigA [Dyadobacter sp. SG02]
MHKAIETEEEFDQALKRFNEVFDAPAGTPEGDEANVLADLIGAYDDEHYPIELPDSVQAERIRGEMTS